MKCSLCTEDIEAQRTPDGTIYWTEGHNAAPLSKGRCCDSCNAFKVIPARIAIMKEQHAKNI